ncbi:uncharacterized protein [Nicotiana sylvestris]|uniref:Uncharacterized protein LOC104244899 n=1 Tax=Nicotiana sylvestris TaxID=4096 RepID=A0A1U7Y3L6_NICSY|nr:PREDICTED: uncharacterized protein LOC104244899 [Nicotiana sylvestris]
MSSTQVMDPLQQPPPMVLNPKPYSDHRDHGLVGPVIGVLVAIAFLGAIAVMIGKICSGRGIMGRGYYDIEGWVETKCGSCIDGRVDPPCPQVTGSPPVVAESGGSGTVSPVPEEEVESREEEASDQQSTTNMHEHIQS